MATTREMARRLQTAFTETQGELLADVIAGAYDDLVEVGDFSELKDIIRDLAQARTAPGSRRPWLR